MNTPHGITDGTVLHTRLHTPAVPGPRVADRSCSVRRRPPHVTPVETAPQTPARTARSSEAEFSANVRERRAASRHGCGRPAPGPARA
jgi:hypothetical protein